MFTIAELRIEYVPHPLGLDVPTPRFSWRWESRTPGFRQASWRLSVTPEGKTGRAALWDSGTVEGEDNQAVYGGRPLAPLTRYRIRLTVTSAAGHTAQAEDWMETGFLGTAPTGKWIAQPRPRPGWASCFRREFTVGPELAQARIYICGLGAAELSLNGEKVGDRLLEPIQTNYEKMVLYSVYDVTARLHPGSNAVGAMVGDGWYNQSRVWCDSNAAYGPCRLLLELHLRYADGREERILSDESFQCDYSPVTLNNIYGGETYDARLEQPGWNAAGFPAAGWVPAVEAPAPGGELAGCILPPIRGVRRLKPAQVLQPQDDRNGQVFVCDMGENFAGIVRLHIPPSPAGTEVVLRFAEEIDGNAHLKYATTGVVATYVHQQDRYIARGDEAGECWEPRFVYHGFRYVEITGLYGTTILPDDFIEGIAVNSDLPPAGEFLCSNEQVNRLQTLLTRTILSNYHGYPEDCPIRERCGWLGDAQLMSEAVMYNFDMAASYEKYLADIRTTKEVFGTWVMIAPGRRVCHRATPLWSSAQAILPWNLYRYYGDRRALEEAYPLMKELTAQYEAESINYILHFGLGDWCPPGGNWPNPRRVPVEVSSTAEFYHVADLTARTAAVLGHHDEAAELRETAARVKEAFLLHYYDPQTHSFGTLGANGAALWYGLCPEGKEALVAAATEKLLQEDCGGAMTTGIWGNKALVPAMTDRGFGGAMLRMLFHPEHTSFATMMAAGAESLWECFEGGEASLNHPMQGAFASWFYSHLLGIRPDEDAPGFRRFYLEPCPNEGIGWARGSYRSLCGEIAMDWRQEGDAWRAAFTIPAGTSALCAFPGDILRRLTVEGEDGEETAVAVSPEKGESRLRLSLDAGRYRVETTRKG